ncbi:MAG: transposase [Paracoccaceae bacterium]
MDRAAFDTNVEAQLALHLAPGTFVRRGLGPMAAHASLPDKLATHKGPRAAQALKDRGCWLLFLPAYSPDLNPIAMAFAKLRARLKRIGARTFEHLLNAIGDTSALFSPERCANFIRHAGNLSA